MARASVLPVNLGRMHHFRLIRGRWTATAHSKSLVDDLHVQPYGNQRAVLERAVHSVCLASKLQFLGRSTRRRGRLSSVRVSFVPLYGCSRRPRPTPVLATPGRFLLGCRVGLGGMFGVLELR